MVYLIPFLTYLSQAFLPVRPPDTMTNNTRLLLQAQNGESILRLRLKNIATSPMGSRFISREHFDGEVIISVIILEVCEIQA